MAKQTKQTQTENSGLACDRSSHHCRTQESLICFFLWFSCSWNIHFANNDVISLTFEWSFRLLKCVCVCDVCSHGQAAERNLHTCCRVKLTRSAAVYFWNEIRLLFCNSTMAMEIELNAKVSRLKAKPFTAVYWPFQKCRNGEAPCQSIKYARAHDNVQLSHSRLNNLNLFNLNISFACIELIVVVVIVVGIEIVAQ